MTWLSAQDHFDPDELDNSVLGIAAELARHDSGPHQHAMGQLLFSQQGCMRITLNNSICMLPPARIAWIPPRVVHRVQVSGVVGYRSVYLDTAPYPGLPEGLTVLTATPLLRAALERIALAAFDTDWRHGPTANILAVCLDEIAQAPRELTLLPLPADRRLRHLAGLETLPPLHELARYSGASEKTISRIFRRETGLSYQQWRQQWRLITAIELLAAGHRQCDVAARLAFTSDSAFATFFRNMTGSPPRAYMAMRES
ncbi:helix-turn-helix transcriptional regulator [Serratia sp. JUb9]|uniref:AraC family transcriptional regulator n=1 Tax=unclassified Serratia (in: enterobacteria) TaxID=2647522 RepID=UPI000CF6089B|nr:MULTISPECIES: helix-turn-helix transcriptional regulator [unclassified Serratia (in: enterobacteria)]MBU3895023.1 helix-turn-helix transcriptional regulator [Serratia rubidaea]AVJ19976.1 AraC family transcriptional regulator [Serratia sp. MYb239]QNK34916.1 helix-turn-helix transcriptional regulator [Serratia sp. JUb9]QPT15664.1 helix-turn-helix transcriptional regulator [Serratia rubidaea]SQJ29985.1 HTH-type transcriptional repressor of iron proteins A [Serratia rubidaea]